MISLSSKTEMVAKTTFRMGCRVMRERENKSRDITKERWEEWGIGIWKKGITEYREMKEVESWEKRLRGAKEIREGAGSERGKKWRKVKTWELWEREAGGAVSDANGWDGICSKVGAKANVQLSRTFVLFKIIFCFLGSLFQHTRKWLKMQIIEENKKNMRGIFKW